MHAFTKTRLTIVIVLLVTLLTPPLLIGATGPRVKLTASGASPAGPAVPIKTEDMNQVRLTTAFGKLPLSFEINRGQADERVKFLARGNGYGLFLTPSETFLS